MRSPNPSSVGIFIGRFQPFHLGHQFIVEQALKKQDQLILILGSANAEPSLKNPFTVEERQALIRANLEFFLPPAALSRVHLMAVPDFPGEDQRWMNAIQTGVASLLGEQQPQTLSILGHDKDKTTYYLDLFKNFKNFEVVFLENFKNIEATKIREAYFSKTHADAWKQGLEEIRHHISPITEEFLRNFQSTPQWQKLMSGTSA